MVEFALALIIFFVLIGAVIDVSRAVWYFNSLQDAVFEATRYAVVHGSQSSSPVGPLDGNYSSGPPATDSTLTNIVGHYMSIEGLKTAQLSVGSSWPNGDNAPLHEVTVAASYPFYPFTQIFSITSLTLSASSTRTIVH